ncbi:isochorismate synthase [Halorhabdus amylolytica]|uniref:isochorismate synthase n=1 Tax=Halorhabdus amylolytica TaxID=2559573 RepID=UPI0010AA2FC1|nr:isochorismate synthase [Halorhabdus amylolytica]
MESARADLVESDDDGGSLVVRGVPVADGSSLPVLAGKGAERPSIVWQGPQERLEALGAAGTITADGRGRFEAVRRRAAALFADREVPAELPAFARPRLFGGFAFHGGTTDRHEEPDWTGFPDAWFVLPAVSLIERDGERWLTASAVGPNAESEAERMLERWQPRLDDGTDTERVPPGIDGRRQLPERDAWTAQVEAAIDRVEEGELRKVVLAGAQSVDLQESLSLPAVIDRLGATYPDCVRFAFQPEKPGAGVFFGATPERLVTRRGPTVETTALAGSTGRGETEAEDAWLAEQLRSSKKDRHEHALVVEAIRDQLETVAETVETGDRAIRKLATVQHLQTPLRATLAEGVHVLSLVAALHPTPAVGGLPPDAALSAIREAEAFDRGWYAAPIGWFDPAGDGSFAVGIRSALARDRTATLFAGAGIVADSDPDAEWDEIQLKYRPILDALR